MNKPLQAKRVSNRRRDPKGIAAVFHDFVNHGTWSASLEMLTAHPELLTDDADAAIAALLAAASKQGDAAEVADLTTHRTLLRNCREFGIAAAFADVVESSSIPPEIMALEERVREALGSSDLPPRPEDAAVAMITARELLGHPGLASLPDAARATMLDLSAIAMLRSGEASGSLDDLHSALDALGKALALTPPNSPAAPGRLNNLANSHADLYSRTGDLADLDAAFAAWDEALRLAPPGYAGRPVYLNNRANRLRDRYARTGDVADLDAALADVNGSLVFTPPDSPYRPRYLYDRANVVSDRYARYGNVADLDAALDDANEALALTPLDAFERPRRLNGRANQLTDRYDLTGNADDLEAAIAAADESIGLTPPGSPDRPVYLHTRAICLSNRYALAGNADDLKESLALVEEALALTAADSPARPSRLNNRANRLADRYALTANRDDLEAALVDVEAALALTPSGSPERAARFNNLGNRLSDRYALTGSRTDLVAGVAAYHDACKAGLVAQPDVAVIAAHSWSAWATDRSAWDEATVAGAFGLEAADRLVRVQAVRANKESRLSSAQGLAAPTAYAWAMLGDGRRAVITAERGRSVLLAESVAIRAALLRLATTGHADLAHDYGWAATRLARSHAPSGEDGTPSAEGLDPPRQAQADLEAAIVGIQAIPGFETFLKQPSDEELFLGAAQSASDGPLVYLLAGVPGGIALTVRKDETVEITALPWLAETTLSDRFSSYIDAYDAFRDDQRAMPAWLAAVDEMTRWLGTAIAGLSQPATKDASVERLTFVPMGLLGLLPLHAAWTESDAPGSNGRRYLLDDLQVSYAPNAQALRTAQTARTVNEDSILAIDEPWPTLAPALPGSAREVSEAVRSVGGMSTVLRHHEATREEVLGALSGHAVVHLSCHGAARPGDPLKSQLLMAFDQPITLGDILEQRIDGTRLVVLSACETALPGAELLDEVVSMPAGLLEAGAAAAIGSLWTVDDLATMALLTRFYGLWRTEGKPLTQALCEAQRWVRDLTPESRADAFPGLDFAGSGEPGIHPYAHPYWWAAFALTGE